MTDKGKEDVKAVVDKVKVWLTDMANTNSSSSQDDFIMEHVLKELLNMDVQVRGGFVYMKPYNQPPASIHDVARTLLKVW